MRPLTGLILAGLLLAPTLQAAANPTHTALLSLRTRMRESCATLPRWKTQIRLSGTPLPVGELQWQCPASFRFLYRGPGAFEYISNGNEAWVARPSFAAAAPIQVDHHWRLDDTDLELFSNLLRTPEAPLAQITHRYRAQTGSENGLWKLTLVPHKVEDFKSLQAHWKLSSGQLTHLRWESPEGLPLVFDLDPPTALPSPAQPRDFHPSIPKSARVTRHPKSNRPQSNQ